MEGSLVGIEFTLWHDRIVIHVGGRNRVVVADRTMTEQDLVNKLLPLDRPFQRHTQIVIVKRPYIETHREGVVPCSSCLEDFKIGGP